MAHMSALPVSKFRHDPPAGRFPRGAAPSRQSIWRAKQQDSGEETRESGRRWNDYFASFQEREISTPEGTFTFLVKAGSDAISTSGFAPWQILKLDRRVLRLFPSAIWDGLGKSVWPTFDGEPSIAESFFDITLPENPLNGFLYLECTVDDTNDYHGKIVSARILSGAEVPFYQRTGNIVNLPLAPYFLTNNGVTIDPVFAFIFVLRRFGPPDSITWDVTPR